MKDFETKSMDPPIPKSKMKSDRGFQHPVVARMLCPCDRLDNFESDPE